MEKYFDCSYEALFLRGHKNNITESENLDFKRYSNPVIMGHRGGFRPANSL